MRYITQSLRPLRTWFPLPFLLVFSYFLPGNYFLLSLDIVWYAGFCECYALVPIAVGISWPNHLSVCATCGLLSILVVVSTVELASLGEASARTLTGCSGCLMGGNISFYCAERTQRGFAS